jgi:hypothetical protein
MSEEVTTFEGIVAVMRQRRITLRLRQLEVDEMAGLPGGYTGKIELALSNPSAKNARMIGRESLPAMLRALGLVLVVAPAQPCRASKNDNGGNKLSRSIVKTLSDRGRKGARILNCRLTPAERRASAQRAAKARWAKRNEARRKRDQRASVRAKDGGESPMCAQSSDISSPMVNAAHASRYMRNCLAE